MQSKSDYVVCRTEYLCNPILNARETSAAISNRDQLTKYVKRIFAQ